MEKNFYTILLSIVFVCSCNYKSSTSTEKSKDTSTLATLTKSAEPIKREPVINAENVMIPTQLYMVMKDSGNTIKELLPKTKVLFSNIDFTINKCKLGKKDAPVAWINNGQIPITVEAGVPINKKCSNKETGIYYKTIKGGKAAVVRFFGPYDLLPRAYAELGRFLTTNKLEAVGKPWEAYITNPELEKDPFAIETDVFVLVK